MLRAYYGGRAQLTSEAAVSGACRELNLIEFGCRMESRYGTALSVFLCFTG